MYAWQANLSDIPNPSKFGGIKKESNTTAVTNSKIVSSGNYHQQILIKSCTLNNYFIINQLFKGIYTIQVWEKSELFVHIVIKFTRVLSTLSVRI